MLVLKFIQFNENVNELSFDDIRDICLELKDEGFFISYYKLTGREKFVIRIERLHKRISYKDVQETILRLKDYLGDNYIDTAFDGNYKNIDSDIRGTYTLVVLTCRTNGIVGLENYESGKLFR